MGNIRHILSNSVILFIIFVILVKIWIYFIVIKRNKKMSVKKMKTKFIEKQKRQDKKKKEREMIQKVLINPKKIIIYYKRYKYHNYTEIYI